MPLAANITFFLDDVAYVIKQRPRGSKVAVVGDFSADLLPTYWDDPFKEKPHRKRHHHEERVLLKACSQAFWLQRVVPEASLVSAGGSNGMLSTKWPIIRIPLGQFAG